MSGIAGAIDTDRPVAPELLERMAGCLRYVDRARTDVWQQGTTGLCRVHHEVTNREPQPVFSADGSKAFVLFGEFHDQESHRKQLEQAGHAFDHPHNDAELGIRLYEEWGAEAFRLLNGSFCFAIADAGAGELLLVSDRFGSRPLYHAQTPRGLVFGTQVAAVLAGEVSRDPDEAAMLEFFHFQRVFGTRTLNRSISLLPPASVLRYRRGTVSVEPWWEMDYRPENGSERDWVEALAHGMRRSAERITRGGHRFGVLLSGGLDSRMVLAACERPLTCYHFNDTRNHEWDKVREIAEAREAPLVYLQRHPDHYLHLLEAAVAIGGGMYVFNHAHTIGLLAGLHDECDFMLHGFVPELYFRGTNLPHVHRKLLGRTYLIDVDWGVTKQNLREKMIQKLKYSLAAKDPAQMFREPYRSAMPDILRASVDTMIAEAEAHSDDVYDQFLWPDTRHHAKYPSFVFESSIRPFLGERSLVFDNDLMDLHLRMPLRRRCNNRVWMRAVRTLHPGIAAVPDANTGYSPFLPTPLRVGLDFVDWSLRKTALRQPRPRQPGHATNSYPRFQETIIHHAGLQALIQRTFDDPRCIDPAIFDVPRLHTMLEEHLAARIDHRNLLFAAVTFGIWHRRLGPAGSPGAGWKDQD